MNIEEQKELIIELIAEFNSTLFNSVFDTSFIDWDEEYNVLQIGNISFAYNFSELHSKYNGWTATLYELSNNGTFDSVPDMIEYELETDNLSPEEIVKATGKFLMNSNIDNLINDFLGMKAELKAEEAFRRELEEYNNYGNSIEEEPPF